MSSALASPSTGGAARATTRVPCLLSRMAEREARGLTRTWSLHPEVRLVIWRSSTGRSLFGVIGWGKAWSAGRFQRGVGSTGRGSAGLVMSWEKWTRER